MRLVQRYPSFTAKKKLLFWIVVNVGLLVAVEMTVCLVYFVATQNTYYLSYGMYDRNWGRKYRDFLESKDGYFKFIPNRTHDLASGPNRTISTRINSLGFRGKDFDPDKQEGTFRIITLG